MMVAGELWYVAFAGSRPHYLTGWLPGALLVGVGVALTFPVLSAASVAGLAPARYSIGGALNQTARQLGAVLGIAILVAVIGTPGSAGQALARFHVAWYVCAAAAVVSAGISLLQPAVRAAVEPAALELEVVTLS
jgi:hypothetical protein